MTKKNRIKVIGHTPELDFKISPGNPWETFFLTLKKHGYEIVEGENRKFDFLIVNSHSPKALRNAIKNGVNRANCVMIYWEPQVTNPLIYTEEVINSYGRVYSPSKTWNEKIGGFYFPWPLDPIPIEIESLENWKRRENKCFLVAGNKFSVNKGNLYKLRRELAYDKNLQKDYLIDLYGQNWNKGLIFDVIQIIISFIKTPLGKWSYKSIGKFGYRYHNYKGEILEIGRAHV